MEGRGLAQWKGRGLAQWRGRGSSELDKVIWYTLKTLACKYGAVLQRIAGSHLFTSYVVDYIIVLTPTPKPCVMCVHDCRLSNYITPY